jgi:hypothetical protein
MMGKISETAGKSNAPYLAPVVRRLGDLERKGVVKCQCPQTNVKSWRI